MDNLFDLTDRIAIVTGVGRDIGKEIVRTLARAATRAVWYLASDAAAFATGTDLIVDGGYTAW